MPKVKGKNLFADFFGDGTGDNLPTGPSGLNRERGYGRGGYNRGGDNRGERGDGADRWRSGKGGEEGGEEEDPNAGRADASDKWRRSGTGGSKSAFGGGNSRFGGGGGNSRFGNNDRGNSRFGGGNDRGNNDRDRWDSGTQRAPNRFGSSGGWRDRQRKADPDYQEAVAPKENPYGASRGGISVMNASESDDSSDSESSSEDERAKSKKQRQQKKRGKKGKKGKGKKSDDHKPRPRRFNEELTKAKVISKADLKSELSKAMEEKSPVTISDLTSGLADLNFQDDSDFKIDLVRVVCLSLSEKRLSGFNWKTLIAMLSDKFQETSHNLITDVVLYLKNKKGLHELKTSLSKEDKAEIFACITHKKDDKTIETFLVEKDLMFLLPTPDLTDYIQDSLEKGKAPKTILKYINEQVQPKINVSDLAVPIAKDAFAKVFKTAKYNIDVLDSYSELLKRTSVKPIDLQAQTMIVYEAQAAWITSKSSKAAIKELFQKLHVLGIVTPEGFVSWRGDRKVKSKGKPKTLLYVNSWLAEIEPQPERTQLSDDEDEGDEGDDYIDEEIDGYLQNPNLAFFR